MSEHVDIGHGVTIWFYEYQGVRAGLIEEHPSNVSPTGRCSGAVAFRGRPTDDPQRPAWEVISEEPLTLSPSLACRTCGHHGFIREGRWVPA